MMTSSDQKEIVSAECPNPLFTRFFTTPGRIEDRINAFPADEQTLAAAYLMYYRGDMDGACQNAGRLAGQAGGLPFYVQTGTGLLLSLCAMYQGDVRLWKKARALTASAAPGNEQEKDALLFWLAAQDSAMHDDSEFPGWLRRGDFDPLPSDSFPSARFFYAKYLYILCKNYRRTGEKNPQKHIEAMRVLPFVTEPLLSETRREGVFLCEIYLHLLCAIAYYFSGDTALCSEHAERAVSLALPDRLYSPLAEYASLMGYVLYERLYEADKEAFAAVKQLAELLGNGWYSLHNALLGRSLIHNLTLREYEVASLAAYDMSNKEIAERLHLSVGTVKQALHTAMGKAHVSSRGELGGLI